jgi:hypothetical protein
MVGIPRALTTDAEDVVWALQTAEALWKRFERADAIVWLRRAAQAAGDAEDDDRALTLANSAAELADWVAQDRDDAATTRPVASPSASAAAEAVDDLLRAARVDDTEPNAPAEDDAQDLEVQEASSGIESIVARADRVPTAAETHAGMLDPWADGNAPSTRSEETSAGPARRAGAVPPAPESEGVLTSAPPVKSTRVSPPAPPLFETVGLDLSRIEALSDLPDDARSGFARAATLRILSPSEEVAGFGLAIVVEGSVHLSATISDVVACSLVAGAIVRGRGTIDHFVSLRLVAGSERARVATWDERLVEQLLRTCPWVEHELRVAGDRFQGEVGVMMGALGTRLDPILRMQVMEKLSLRALSEREACAIRGNPVPGLLVVAAGELELVDDDGIPDSASLRPGEFLFPAEFLRAAPAPRTARARTGGALVLMADRRAAQELLVTCPPLLEIFGGG